MSILDRYIARQFFFNVIALFVILFSFVIAVDAALNLDRFTRGAAQLTRDQDISALARIWVIITLIWNMWWPRLLQLYNFMLGFVLMGGMGFTFSQMVRNREIVAMLAGGIGLHTVFRPVLIVALGLSVLQLANQELVIPRIAPLLTRDHGDVGRQQWETIQSVFAAESTTPPRKLFAREFNNNTDELLDLHIWECSESGVPVREITASRAVWRNDRWMLTDGVSRPFRPVAPLGESHTTEDRSVYPVESVQTTLDPTSLLLLHHDSFRQTLSWRRISQIIHSSTDPERINALRRAQFGRVSAVLCNLLTLVITMPFFVTREPKNMVIQSLKSSPVGIISLIGAVLGIAAEVPGLPAAFAVFLPVFILAPIAIAVTTSLKT